MEPDAIVVLAGGIKRDVSGRWVSTELTAADNELCAPGGKLRVLAAAALATTYPNAAVVASGGKGYDVPKDAPEDRPMLAEIVRDELLECGVPGNRIMLEQNSNTTYQQLQELETVVAQRNWRSVIVVTNRYNLARLRAMLEAKFPKLIKPVKPVSAEEILLENEPVRWGAAFGEAYGSGFMAERIAKEEQGVSQIKDGTYQFR